MYTVYVNMSPQTTHMTVRKTSNLDLLTTQSMALYSNSTNYGIVTQLGLTYETENTLGRKEKKGKISKSKTHSRNTIIRIRQKR